MYQVENPIGKAMSGMGQASGTFAAMGQDRKQIKPDPTVGGGLMAGMGGAVAGAQVGTMVGGTAAAATTAGSAVATGAATGSAAGPWGAAIGAIIGIGAYLLS